MPDKDEKIADERTGDNCLPNPPSGIACHKSVSYLSAITIISGIRFFQTFESETRWRFVSRMIYNNIFIAV